MLVPSLLCRGRCLGKKLRKKARKLRKGNKKCRDKSVDDDDGSPSTSIGAEVSTASVANGKPEGEGDGAHVADAGADPVPRHDREVREDASDRTRVGDGGAPLAEARDEDGGYGEGRPRPRGAVGCPLLSEASSFSLVAAMASQDTQEEDAGAGEEEEEGDGDDDDEEVPRQSPSVSSDSSLDEPQRAEVESGNDDNFRPDEAFPPLETASSSLSCFSLVKLFQEEEEDGGEGGEGIISPPDIDVLHLVSQSSSGIGSTAFMVSECASGTTPDGEVSAGADDNEEDVDDTDGDGDRHAPMEDYPVEATQIRHQIGDGASASPVASCGAGVGESSIAAAAAAATTGDHPSRGPDEDEVVADASPPAAPASLSDPPSFDAPLADDGSERGPVISSVPSSCTVVDDDEGKQPEQEQRQATEEEDGAHERGEPDEKHEDEDRDRSDVWHYAEIEATDSRVEVSFSLSPRRANEDTYVVADEDDEDDECSELEVRTAASAAKRRSGDAKLTPGLVEDEEGSLPLKRARTSTTLRKAAPIRFDGWACFAPNGVEGGNFAILGTSANDLQSRPHVLSPPLMESLRSFLPFSCSEENFWMKYSLIRDGASYETLLSKVRASRRTVLAIETMEGEVFGSFTSSPWRVQPDFFGSGEAFLWRLKKSRWFVPGDKEETTLLRRLDSEIEVYPYTNFDRYIQLCTRDRMALGGGQWQPPEDCPYPDELAEGGGGGGGMGLVLGEELETGSSHTCATFASPGLSRLSSMNGGRQFQIANVEVWTLTPFATVQAAETSDLRKSFIEEQTSRAVHSY